MKLTELANHIELTEEELNSETITRAFPIDCYFNNDRIFTIITEEELRDLPNCDSVDDYMGPGYYDEKGRFFGSEDHHVNSTLVIISGEIISASYSVDNFRNKTAGRSIEDDVDGVVDLWIETFEL